MAAFWLIGGYALIVLSYAFVWGIAATFSQCHPSQRMNGLTRADVKAVLAMMCFWTTAWGVIEIFEVLR